MPTPRRILIINLAGAGDIVISSAAIRALKKHCSGDELHLLTFRQNRTLVKNCPYLKSIFEFEQRLSPHNFGVLSGLRNMRFDIAVNLYNINTFKGALKIFVLLKIIAAKQTFGRNTNGRGFFYDRKIDERIPFVRHDTEAMLEVVSLLGADSRPQNLEMWIDMDNTSRVEEILRKNNINENDSIICIHPGARQPSHRWSAGHFAEVGRRLYENHAAKIIITGDRDEFPLAEKIAQAINVPAVVLSGQLSIADLAIVFKKSILVIVNDTGPMHIANVLGTPMVVVAGNSSEVFLPYRKEKTVVLCSTAGITSISPQRVIEAAESLLGG